MDISTNANALTVEQTDELILAASKPGFGAIEDCEVSDTAIAYFFEDGTIGTVDRSSGDVTFTTVQQ